MSPRGAGPLTGGGVPQMERGTIISVDARGHVYRVALNSGRTMQMARIRTHPGDLTLLPLQSAVLVTWSLGLPYILGVLPSEVAAATEENPQSVTDVEGHGGNDPVFQRNMAAVARAPGEPIDVMPGDFTGLSPDGASVSALHGQVAQLRGGSLAKVQAFGASDTVQIIAGVYRLISWMGEAKIVNNNGKTSFIWRGGTDQITQTGPDEEKYTIRLDVGQTGDVIRLEVTTREGQVVFRFHVSASGACEIFAAGGINQHGGGADSDVNPVRFQGQRQTEVSGGSTERVNGSVTHTCNGSNRRDVGGDDTRNIGGSQSIYVTQDHSLQVSGDSDETIAGKKSVTALEGISHETMGAGLYEVKTQAANIELTPGTAKLQVKTAIPDAIELGYNPTSHVTKFEEMQTAMLALKLQLDLAMALIATHFHPPAGPTFTAPAPTLAPLATPLPFDMSLARSILTKTT